jgi:hypothetical protein
MGRKTPFPKLPMQLDERTFTMLFAKQVDDRHPSSNPPPFRGAGASGQCIVVLKEYQHNLRNAENGRSVQFLTAPKASPSSPQIVKEPGRPTASGVKVKAG